MPSNDADRLAMIRARVAKKDPEAINLHGGKYFFGKLGLQKDSRRAVELWTEAAELGSIDALFGSLGLAHRRGEGVQKDMSKAVEFYEKAAMQGHVASRHNLGEIEWKKGNHDRALRHLLISAQMGDKESLESIKRAFMIGKATKEHLAPSSLHAETTNTRTSWDGSTTRTDDVRASEGSDALLVEPPPMPGGQLGPAPPLVPLLEQVTGRGARRHRRPPTHSLLLRRPQGSLAGSHNSSVTPANVSAALFRICDSNVHGRSISTSPSSTVVRRGRPPPTDHKPHLSTSQPQASTLLAHAPSSVATLPPSTPGAVGFSPSVRAAAAVCEHGPSPSEESTSIASPLVAAFSSTAKSSASSVARAGSDRSTERGPAPICGLEPDVVAPDAVDLDRAAWTGRLTRRAVPLSRGRQEPSPSAIVVQVVLAEQGPRGRPAGRPPIPGGLAVEHAGVLVVPPAVRPAAAPEPLERTPLVSLMVAWTAAEVSQSFSPPPPSGWKPSSWDWKTSRATSRAVLAPAAAVDLYDLVRAIVFGSSFLHGGSWLLFAAVSRRTFVPVVSVLLLRQVESFCESSAPAAADARGLPPAESSLASASPLS
ncbi:hypothetical protein THAOC_03831 [Thalassiosira oceanica]|uniref:Uncharacterized protein n=1 Tax=Thalassiosira oceanica TaxID=159749 RepID=K0TPH9_THAOC|nr:hypothetical protein THAOC_03831 [Thalassiosira oceanica]|eukprot:EJK74487.1 hypothetical protein THAOC_03831 [Thalassiosira oceanica]